MCKDCEQFTSVDHEMMIACAPIATNPGIFNDLRYYVFVLPSWGGGEALALVFVFMIVSIELNPTYMLEVNVNHC